MTAMKKREKELRNKKDSVPVKKPDIKQKIPKTKNKNKIKTPSPIKKGPSDLMNLENAVSGVLKIIDDLEAQSDINPWVNKAHFDAIKKFSVHRFSASHIVPPGKDSLINALESADNPLLSNVKIFPSREIGSGESIDQHVRQRHPKFFSDVCKNEADQFDNIRRLSEVAISVLNDIESIRESDEFNIPYENIMIKVPTLLVEGRFNGEKVRVVLSKPYNKLLGLGVFDRIACLVVRSIYLVEDARQANQKSFA